MNTRKYSKKQEDSVAKLTQGRTQFNSGATPYYKGDVTTKDFLLECKTVIKRQKSISIKEEWIIKLKNEAFGMGKNRYALAFNFGPDESNYFILNEKQFQEYQELINKDVPN